MYLCIMEQDKNITLKKFFKSVTDSTRVLKYLDTSLPWYNCVEEVIGHFYSLKEAEASLADHPIDDNIVGYSIEGPEYGRKIDHEELDPLSEKEFPDEYFVSDESPEFVITYNADKTVNAKYTFGEHKPGGSRYLNEPNAFKAGDIVWVLQPGYRDISTGLSAIYPAKVVQTLTLDFIKKYYKVWLEEYTKRHIEENPFPSEEFKQRTIESRINSLLDLEWDSIVVKPLVLLRGIDSSFGNNEEEFIPRYMIYPYKNLDV